MAGGKATAKKDEQLKVSGGQLVKTGQIVVRGINSYKAGRNVAGKGTLYALCPGKTQFIRKKTPHGKFRTFISIVPMEKEEKK